MFDISSQREIPQQGELYSRVQESVVILAVSLFGLQHACEFADHLCFVERSCGIHRFPELPVATAMEY